MAARSIRSMLPAQPGLCFVPTMSGPIGLTVGKMFGAPDSLMRISSGFCGTRSEMSAAQRRYK